VKFRVVRMRGSLCVVASMYYVCTCVRKCMWVHRCVYKCVVVSVHVACCVDVWMRMCVLCSACVCVRV